MAVQEAFVRAGAAQHLLIKVSELSVDGCHCRHGVTLTEGEDILPAASGFLDVELKEAAVEECDQWDGR